MTDTPLLSISCPRCGRQWRHLADWHNHNRPPPCPACGGRLHVIRLRPRTVELQAQSLERGNDKQRKRAGPEVSRNVPQ